MIDLSTQYLGLKLDNPLVPSSSPLTGDFDAARRLEDLGAGALVLPSLFEEELVHEQERMSQFLDHQDIGHAEASTFLPDVPAYQSRLDQYLNLITRYKAALNIPVIGSLNGISKTGWLEHAKDLQEAGCDALEINLYSIIADPKESSDDIERRYTGIVHELSQKLTIPVTVKLSNQFTALTHFVNRLESAGAIGLVCFNRFYQPDIDLDSLHVVPRLQLSSSAESWERVRWIAILKRYSSLSLAATGGFHTSDDIAKALLAGADVVYLCSVLLQQGVEHLNILKSTLSTWMEDKEYESAEQLKGSLSHQHAINPDAYERANYIEVLHSFNLS